MRFVQKAVSRGPNQHTSHVNLHFFCTLFLMHLPWAAFFAHFFLRHFPFLSLHPFADCVPAVL